LIERPLPGLSFAAVGFLLADILQLFYTHRPGRIVQVIGLDVKIIPELCIKEPDMISLFIDLRGR